MVYINIEEAISSSIIFDNGY